MLKVSVLVTGGAGYIGSHAVLALLDRGWSVCVLDDLSNGTRELVPSSVPILRRVDCGSRVGNGNHRGTTSWRNHALCWIDRGYGSGLSVLEVLDAVDRVFGKPLVRKIKPRRAGDPPALTASNKRLIKTLGWKPRFDDIETIVTHALKWELRSH